MAALDTKEIDDLLNEYDLNKQAQKDEKEEGDELKDDIIALCRQFGSIPDGAEKSLRLEGTDFQATATWGTSTSVDEKQITKLQAMLAALDQSKLFRKLFVIVPSYVPAPDAAETLAALPAPIRRAFNRVMITTLKDPSLKVERRKVKRARKSSAA